MSLARLTLCLITLSTVALGASAVDLNADWRFHVDPSKTGEQQGWSARIPEDAERVDLPHTWNVGKYHEFQGTGWYFKSFSSSSSWNDKHVEVHFGATFYKSRVWLNGKLLGEHEGGYTEYFFDITKALRSANLLVVEINNEPKVDTIPGADLKAAPNGTIYDWWPYGGIVRGAWLTVNEGIVARWQHINARPTESEADLADRIQLENATGKPQRVKLRIAVFPDDRTQASTSTEKDVDLRSGKQSVDLNLHLTHVIRWDLDNPSLYRSEITVLARDGHVLDAIADNFGVRSVEIRDRHLYLNGERVRLTGVARHEDSPWEGLAETRGTMLHDFQELKYLHTTLTRPVHYPQHTFIYAFADRNGILMIPEIPMWQFDETQMKNPRVLALAKQELHDLIEQNYNHPSIFAWSMDNESATNTPGGVAYFQQMYAYSKQLDPERYVSFADDVIASADPATNASRYADFVMWNEYFGSWDGPETMLPAAFEKVDKGYPDKMVLITEFGYPGVFATDPATADKERQRIIGEQLALFARKDWIGGALLWCYQDYQSTHNLRAGQDDNYVDHGIVDKDRQRRPSYYVWRDATAPAHIHAGWDVDAKGVPTGFHATVERRSEQEIPSYSLINYRIEWRVLDDKKKEVAHDARSLPDIGPPQELRASWSPQASPNLRLELTLYQPSGRRAQEKILLWRNPQQESLAPQDFGTVSQ